MWKFWRGCIGLGAWVLMSCGVAAQEWRLDPPRAFQWLAEVGGNKGGDLMANGTYANTGGKWDVYAGDGLQGGIGLQYAFNDTLATQLSVSYLVDTTQGANGDVAFKRTPVELMLIHNLNEHWRVGGGWHQSFSSKRTNTGVVAFLGTENFTSTPGAVVQLMYFFKPYKNLKQPGDEINTGLGLRWVTEQFTSQRTSRAYQADHMGVFLSLYF